MKSASAEVIPAEPGVLFAGGIFAGRFFIGAEAFALVVAPKADAELAESIWNESRKLVLGATNVYDGVTNTQAMAAAGSALAKWAQDLRVGGFDDWYIPSRGEALLAFASPLEGAAAFEEDWYWTSTQYAGDAECAWVQPFDDGYQYAWRKDGKDRARAVRRVKIT